MRRDLDDDVGVGQVDRGVAHLGDEDGVVLGARLELLEDAYPLRLRRRPVNEGPPELDRVLFEREDIVGEDDDLVAASLVEAHQVLARSELVRVHRVEQPLDHRVLAEVLVVELGGHGAPDLGTLHLGDEAALLQVEPVGFVELGPDEEVEVVDLLVLAHQRRGEAELAA